jgi:SWI/SNF related-matrix-associated actin-dependent regulator of chromatin subfamily C
VYDEKGKELKPKESSSQANGDQQTNGDATTKAMDDAAKEPKKTINCYSCGIDCTRSRFHYAKTDPATASSAANKPDELKYDLCPNCYFQSRMPSSHRSSDFVKMEDPSYSTIPDKDAEWTDSELLLLLEGLEQFDNNWTDISNHVGTRTREECVMKFLQLDIQDQFMDDIAPTNGNPLRALGGGRDPISQAENPVMSVVSFLAQLADPKVVAAASQRGTEQLQKDLRERLEKGMGGSDEAAKEQTTSTEAVKPEQTATDSMDVDATAAAPTTNGTSKVDLPSLALASAATRSSILSSHQERELTRLVSAAVNLSLQKLDLKLSQFSEMEELIQAERRDLEKGRQQLFLDRLAFKKRVRDMEMAFRQASLKTPEEGMRLMAEVVGGGRGQGYVFGGSGEGADVRAPSVDGGEGYRKIEI